MITYHTKNGEWGIEGVDLSNLEPKVYGALCKLLEYEKTGFTPEEIEDLKMCMDIENDGYSGDQTLRCLIELMQYRKRQEEFDNLYLEKCKEVNRLKEERECLRRLLPSCVVGDTVYYLDQDSNIYETTITKVTIIQEEDGTDYFYDGTPFSFCNKDIGESVFFEREEAEHGKKD